MLESLLEDFVSCVKVFLREGCLLRCSGQALLMLATPTSALYMESLAGATKGKVRAAAREAEQKKTEKKEDTENGAKTKQDTRSSSSDSNSEPASPAQ